MKTTEIKIEKLKLAEYNPRTISEKELTNLKKSLDKFGFIQPVVINKDFTVISGHQRIRAWKEMGNEEVPTIQLAISKNEEKLGRNAYLMELDPRFVDVIIYRWEKYTKRKAKKL